MSIVRVGATKQYSDNWDNIFAGSGGGRSATKKKTAKPARSAAKKSAKVAVKSGSSKRATVAKRKRK